MLSCVRHFWKLLLLFFDAFRRMWKKSVHLVRGDEVTSTSNVGSASICVINTIRGQVAHIRRSMFGHPYKIYGRNPSRVRLGFIAGPARRL